MTRLIIAAMALVLAASAPVPHKVVRHTATLDFSYRWSHETAAIPALDRKFYDDAKAKLVDAQLRAREDRALARQQKREFHQHDFTAQWDTAGESQRLLSLAGEMGEYEGGAHPNTNYSSLLWDRETGRETTMGSLFVRAGDFATLTRAAYCKALDRERLKRRQGEKLDWGEFNECPKYAELAIAPLDKNSNGRFDRISFVASPYVAGPYVEGEYEIVLPVTGKLIAALKPEYRSSFEAQRQ